MTPLDYYDLFFRFSWISTLIPIVLLGSYWSRLSSAWRWLVVALLVSFVCDMIGELMISVFHGSPNVATIIYQFVSLPVLSVFLVYALRFEKYWKYFVIGNVTYLILVALNVAYVQKMGVNTYAMMVPVLLVLIFSLVFFYQLLQDIPSENVLQMPFFWVFSGMVISYSVKLVVYAVTQYLLHVVRDNLLYIWIVHNIFSIIGNGFFAYAAWLLVQTFRKARQASPI